MITASNSLISFMSELVSGEEDAKGAAGAAILCRFLVLSLLCAEQFWNLEICSLICRTPLFSFRSSHALKFAKNSKKKTFGEVNALHVRRS